MVDIDRINQLAKKKKTVGLTKEETREQERLRKEYVASVLGNLRSQLNNSYVIGEGGKEVKLTPKTKIKRNSEDAVK